MAGTQNEPSSSGVHDGLAGTLAESIVEVGTPVLSEVIASERLTTVLVDTLENLVPGGVTQTGEERGELAAERGVGVLLEDNLVQTGGGGNLTQRTISPMLSYSLVRLRDRKCRTRVWLLINRLEMVSTWSMSQFLISQARRAQSMRKIFERVGYNRTGWKTINSAIPAVPETES